MADEQLRQDKHGKQDMKPVKESLKPDVVRATKKTADEKSKEVEAQKDSDIKAEQTGEEVKPVETKEEKKPEVKVKKAPHKKEVSVSGRSLPISLKYSKGIGKFIRGKRIDDAVKDLELVRLKKKAVPMVGEMAHKKGKGMATGKYPLKASENFIRLLKSLSANCTNHGMDLDKTRIFMTVPNKAPEQVHRGGRMLFKRTHVKIIAKEGK
jgi:large subunit ribosomal protein L22